MTTDRPIYRGRASAADRFTGGPCGCVFIVRGCAFAPKGLIMQADHFYDCCQCVASKGQPVTLEIARADLMSAATYHYPPADAEESYRLVPWQ